MCKRIKLDHFLTLHTNIISKLIRDLNVRTESIKILEENIGSTLFDNGLRYFLGYVSSGKGNKSKNKQMILHQNKILCTVKETINKRKKPPTK